MVKKKEDSRRTLRFPPELEAKLEEEAEEFDLSFNAYIIDMADNRHDYVEKKRYIMKLSRGEKAVSNRKHKP